MLVEDRESHRTTFVVSEKLVAALNELHEFGSPRLTVELVPKSSFFENIRNHISNASWTRLRKVVAEKAGHVCEICGGQGSAGRVECHERWKYDDDRRIQTLEGLIVLCPACHAVKHIGRQIALGFGDVATIHLADVNDWTRDRAEAYVDAAGHVWYERSKHAWKLDLRWASELGLDVERRTPRS